MDFVQKESNVNKRKKILAEVFDWLKIFLFAAIVAWLCNHFIIMNAIVPSGSMENTIANPSRIISLRFAYWFSDPQRGDVVIFDPPDGDECYYVKRIIGLPGETITIINGDVYVNDSSIPLDEPYLKEPARGSFGPYEIPDGCYFVMGDNRNHSKDARFWDNTYVPRKSIHAKTIFSYWPHFSWIQ